MASNAAANLRFIHPEEILKQSMKPWTRLCDLPLLENEFFAVYTQKSEKPFVSQGVIIFPQ